MLDSKTCFCFSQWTTVILADKHAKYRFCIHCISCICLVQPEFFKECISKVLDTFLPWHFGTCENQQVDSNHFLLAAFANELFFPQYCELNLTESFCTILCKLLTVWKFQAVSGVLKPPCLASTILTRSKLRPILQLFYTLSPSS